MHRNGSRNFGKGDWGGGGDGTHNSGVVGVGERYLCIKNVFCHVFLINYFQNC